VSKEYYTPVEFPELEEPKEVKIVKDPLPKVEWTSIMTEVRRMICAIESGLSQIVPGAMQVTNTSGAPTPLTKCIAVLEVSPSEEALRQFLKIAQQDINMRFRQECVKIFNQHVELKKFMEVNNIE
jgi:hypothetical protein